MASEIDNNPPYRERRTVIRTSAYRGMLDPQRVPEHEHPELQFVVGQGVDNMEAAWQDDTGNQCHGKLHANAVAIIPSGQPHTFAWRAPALVSCVYIDQTQLKAAMDADEQMSGRDLRPGYGINDSLIRELIVELAREAEDDFRSGRVYAETLEQTLLQTALRRRAKPGRAQLDPDLQARRLARVLDYIETHYTEDVSLDDLAAVAGISRFYFAHAFKAATGTSPHRYLTARRIQEAKRLLRTEIPINTIAADLGFSDQAHFSTRFRNMVGTSPKAFRNGQ